MMQSRIIGLTGGISSGKSTISNMLIEKGYSVVDADKIAKNISNIGSKTYFKILEHFGREILLENKEIDRKKLGYIIFSSSEERRILNEISHGDIMEEIKKQLKLLLGKKELIFLDIPLLIENLDDFNKRGIVFDEIILICLSRDEQIKRLMARDGIDRELAIKKIQAQMPLEEKKKYASIIIENDGSLDELKFKLELILKSLI